MRSIILGDHVGIRRYRIGDAQDLYEAVRVSVVEIEPWLPWCHNDYTLEEAEAFVQSCIGAWEDGLHYSFRIFDRDTDVFLGAAALNYINPVHGFANLGYWVRTDRTGHGIASSAARLAARFGLEDVGLNRIEIVAALENVASQRAAVKAGAVREGVLRNRLALHGKLHHAVMHSIVAD